MKVDSKMLLMGIGGAGTSMARGVHRAFGGDLNYLLVDTDARSGEDGEPFVLLGGDRLSGRGAGGSVVTARRAAEETVDLLDDSLEGVRLVVIVTALGGGTGGGATSAVVRRLRVLGIPSVVFATLPFACEGTDRDRNAREICSMIQDEANLTFALPLDKLVGTVDYMDVGLRRAVDTMASGVTLFWRLVEKPGYIRLDIERIRHLLGVGGRGRFATVTECGDARAEMAVDGLKRSELLVGGSAPVRAMLCGVLAGDDLRLSELGTIASGLQSTFGGAGSFDLATVNDEETFAGRLSVVVMLIEEARETALVDPELLPPTRAQPVEAPQVQSAPPQPRTRAARKPRSTGKPVVLASAGRFSKSEPTCWNEENLDTPTFLRKGITLEF